MSETKKTTEVATTSFKEASWTDEQVQLIKNTVAKGATNDELKLFLYTAKRTGLDPLTKQIHFVKRAGQMTVQTGIDGYRAIAERSNTLAGIDDGIYEEQVDANGNRLNKPLKATVTVYRMVNGERVPFTASARWSEYAPQGGQAFMWQKMPYLMLGKCAEALALRKAFPNDLTGLYTNEEMAQADTTPSLPPEVTSANIKQKISSLLVTLKGKDGVTKENVKEVVKELTTLDLVEENYQEILNRLEILVGEKAEAKHE